MIDYSSVLSDRVKEIKPSGIRKFFDIAAEMDDVISLSIGEPDFKTPYNIREAGITALQKGHTFYTSNKGMQKFRDSICKYLKNRFNIEYSSTEQCLVTVGGSEAIDLTIRALLNEGDEVLIPTPCYVAYEPMVELAGGKSVIIPTKAENSFRLTGQEVKERLTDKTKLLILPFPNNPTGAVMRREHLEEIAEALKGTNVMILSDEIYAELTYGDKHVSCAEIDGLYERTVLVSGFSKAFAMTGWRLGYACGPEPIISQITKIHQYAIMCAPTISQYGAIEALENSLESTEYMKEKYDMRRRFLIDALSELGLTCFEPMGAFYIFPSIKNTGLSSEEFCQKLLKEEHVAVVPGTAFGESGEGFVRISYSYSLEHLKEAVKRIKRFLEKIRG